ncbi:MAG TPA: hypothetical protein VJH23_04445, partial [archaeon]|nr:hypothetical protein [archaeon]
MDEKLRSNIIRVGILGVLLVALLGVLILTGIMGCNVVPGGCEVYYLAVRGGSPSILVVYSDYGLGDPDRLVQYLNEKDIIRAHAKTMDIEKLTYANVRDYDLIVVERAKKICSSKLKIFQYYVAAGGRLVWTGDAGTELCSGFQPNERLEQNDKYLLEKEHIEGGSDAIIGPWARKDFGQQLLFDEFLGVEYKGNYCDFSTCPPSAEVGRIEVTNSEHKLAYGLSPSIPYKGDFAVVEVIKDSDARIVAVLDYGANLLGKGTGQPWLESGKQYNFGRQLPFIVSTQVGERVAYYSAPIESLVGDAPEARNKALLEQMYYGML